VSVARKLANFTREVGAANRTPGRAKCPLTQALTPEQLGRKSRAEIGVASRTVRLLQPRRKGRAGLVAVMIKCVHGTSGLSQLQGRDEAEATHPPESDRKGVSHGYRLQPTMARVQAPKNILIGMYLAYIPFMFLGLALVDPIVRARPYLGPVFMLSLFVSYCAVALVAAFRYDHWRCPRCGQWFMRKWWYTWFGLNKCCVHCGLPKYSNG